MHLFLCGNKQAEKDEEKWIMKVDRKKWKIYETISFENKNKEAVSSPSDLINFSFPYALVLYTDCSYNLDVLKENLLQLVLLRLSYSAAVPNYIACNAIVLWIGGFSNLFLGVTRLVAFQWN